MKKTLALCIYSTHDRLFASVVTALSFLYKNPDLECDLYLYIDYFAKKDESITTELIARDIEAVKKIIPDAIIKTRKEEIDFLFSGLNMQVISQLLGQKLWTRAIWAKLAYIKLLNKYQYVMHLDNDILVQNSLLPFLGKEGFYLLGKANAPFTLDYYSKIAKTYLSQKYPDVDFNKANGINGGVVIYSDAIQDFEKIHELFKDTLNWLAPRCINDGVKLTEEFILFAVFAIAKLKISYNNYLQIGPRNFQEFGSNFSVHAAITEKFWSHNIIKRLCPEWDVYYSMWTIFAKGRGYTGKILPYLDDTREKICNNLVSEPIWCKFIAPHIHLLRKDIYLSSDMCGAELTFNVSTEKSLYWTLSLNNQSHILDLTLKFYLPGNRVTNTVITEISNFITKIPKSLFTYERDNRGIVEFTIRPGEFATHTQFMNKLTEISTLC